jgi:glutamate/tyrosine decarboxylase-like PLP-dependent enzyme
MIDARHVGPKARDVEALSGFDEPLGEVGADPLAVIQQLDEVATPATMGVAGRRFFGFVIGGSLPVTVAADWLASAWDQNAGLFVASPATAALETVSLRWLNEVFGFPGSTEGAFVTGATMANFTALAAARHAVLARAGWDVEADGLTGAPPITVVASAEAHPTLFKAVAMLGLGRNRVTRLPVDGQGRVRPDALPTLRGPVITCLQAGNINTGAFDPFAQLLPTLHEAGAWVHVDGAFGLWAAASPRLASLTTGVQEADSWATDAHKWLNVPYDSGLAFVRDGQALRAAMRITAEYLPPTTSRRDPSDFTPELSRRARGVTVWAALKSLGKNGLAELVDRPCRHARRFAEGLRAAGYEVLNDVVLNQLLVSFGDADTTDRVIAGIQEDGTCWCGGTTWQGRRAMRISVSSWATTDEDVELSLEAMLRVAAGVKEGSAR